MLYEAKPDFKSIAPTLLMCSCCCWNCCLCFSKNCWCCCWITNCWRAWAFCGRGADCVRPSGRCCRSLCIEGETRSPPTRDCAWRGSPERYQSEDNMEEKTAEKEKKEEERKGENGCWVTLMVTMTYNVQTSHLASYSWSILQREQITINHHWVEKYFAFLWILCFLGHSKPIGKWFIS